MNEFETAFNAIDPAQQYATAPKAPRYTATRRDLTYAAFLLVFSILFTDCLFYAKTGLGVGAGFAAFFLTLHFYLQKSRRERTVFSVFCGLSVLLGAACFVFSGDRLIIFLLFVSEILLTALTLRESMALRSGSGVFRVVCDLCQILFVLTFGRIAEGCRALFQRETAEGTRQNRRTLSALLGLACAIPVLAVLIPLLVSSDAAFEGLIKSIDAKVIRECLVAVLTGAALCLLLFSQMISLNRCRVAPSDAAKRRGIEPLVVGMFLAAVCAAYLLYLFSQLAYFFSAFRGLLPKDFTVAQYARRGFFEMCGIVFLNLCMVLLAVNLCRKKENGRLPGLIRALLLFLCVFSVAMVATALSKMLLYVRSFGMTRLRILTSVFMLFLAAVVVVVALRLFFRGLPLWKLTVTVGVLCLLSVGFVNVDRIVAAYNVHAYQSGALESVDMETLDELSDASVPYLAELLSDSDHAVAHHAALTLFEHAKELLRFEKTENGGVRLIDDSFDLRGFNLTHQRAKQVIARYWEQILLSVPRNAIGA